MVSWGAEPTQLSCREPEIAEGKQNTSPGGKPGGLREGDGESSGTGSQPSKASKPAVNFAQRFL